MNRMYRHKETDFHYQEGGYQVEIIHGTDREEKDIEVLIIPIDYLRRFVRHVDRATLRKLNTEEGGE